MIEFKTPPLPVYRNEEHQKIAEEYRAAESAYHAAKNYKEKRLRLPRLEEAWERLNTTITPIPYDELYKG